MVAAGATALMAAGDSSGTSKTADNGIQGGQQLNSDGGRSRATAFTSRRKDSSITPNKTASIRETKTSRLRAASIVSPSDNSNIVRRSGLSETTVTPSRSSPHTSSSNSSTTQKTPMGSRSSGIPQIFLREREKHRQPSAKLSDGNEKLMDSTTSNEKTITRNSKKLSKSSPQQPHAFPTTSNIKHSRHLYNNHQTPSTPSHRSSSISTSPSLGKNSPSHHSPSYASTEVLQRVDALTALTRATMERVKRLASSSSSSSLHSQPSSPIPISIKSSPRLNPKRKSSIHNNDEPKPSSISISHQSNAPVSILKHKTAESSDSIKTEYVTNSLPTVAFKLNENPIMIIKKHGILKKRSSLDENEILRRNSNSPDNVSILINTESSTNDSDFRPILKYERRSSLDELIKITNNVDPRNPPSILKNKWSRSGDEERDDQSNPERQGILKKNSLVDAVAKTLGVTWTELESLDHRKYQEVRPILKKKLSHDESSSSDPPSLEPRPILKKKSSTDSDEHEERPRKTILKYSSSRKNSEDSSNESETVPSSPKKLSVLKQHSLQRRTNSLPECDTLTVMKPILKNSRSRSIQSTSLFNDLFLRKRARSVGHEHTEGNEWLDWRGEEGCGGGDGDGEQIDSDQVVTFKFPEDYKEEMSFDEQEDLRLGFSSEEAACRRLDDYSAKMRRDKRLSRRFRDRREIHNQLSSITSDVNKTVVVDYQHWGIEAMKYKNDQNSINNDQSLPKMSYLGITKDNNISERFSTQPVTCQEVQEAAGLLKKDKNHLVSGEKNLSASSCNLQGRAMMEGGDDSIDPSKLSLTQRVAFFNRKIATESAAKAGLSLERIQRRALSRFRTQPVTSEEVEDAVRHIPNVLVTDSDGQEHSSGRQQNVKNHDTPKSILKSSSSYTVCNLSQRSSSTKLDLRLDLSQELTEKDGSLQVLTSTTDTYSNTMKRYTGCTVPSYDYTDNKVIDKNCGKNKKKTISTVICDKESRGEIECDQLDNKSFKGIPTTQSLDFPGVSIADRLAALKRNGSTNWKRRIISESLPPSVIMERPIENDKDGHKSDICQKENDEFVITQKKLAHRLEKLESAAEGWRKRVATADAVKFSVAGKMRLDQIDTIDHSSKLVFESMGNCSSGERRKKTPHKNNDIKREIPVEQDSSDVADRKPSRVLNYNNGESENLEVSTQNIPKLDDETFTSFFNNISLEKCLEESIVNITSDDFDLITSASEKLCLRRTTQVQRRRVFTHHNPLKTLAARTDLKSEYTEVKTGVAERLMKLKNMEKLGKNSSLAVEALAGLASTENFASITLKSTEDTSNGFIKFHPKDCHLFLILIKGRRHVQVRLVEPIVSSINSGDNYILVTRSQIYHYIGKYSNVIEKSRATEIALSIQQSKDMGCKAPRVVTLDEQKSLTNYSTDFREFWNLLGHLDNCPPEIADAGHPDEDEQYESALIDTNVVYEVSNNQLIPLEKYWGAIPKIKMLDPSKILVFDFGCEMYIWNGKCAPVDSRKSSIQLSETLWNEGYDYSDCSISPIDAASLIGRRSIKKSTSISMKQTRRPDWCLSAKLTQHMETILFREKFLDWPNAYGIIKCKRPDEDKDRDRVDGKIVIDPPDVDDMINHKNPPVDLVLEGCHLGRGSGWFDGEFSRQYLVTTTDVTVWHIDDYSYSRIDNNSAGQFFSGDSYIIRWMYLITVTGRELSGLPSKHAVDGRDRCAYFIWQGKTASLNKQGTAALLTVELDKEQGPQIRIVEGFEPPAFLNLFKGGMVIHSGKKSQNDEESSSSEGKKQDMMAAFFCRGTRESETSLVQVPYSSRQFKTRGSLLFINFTSDIIYVWYGKNCLPHVKRNTFHAAKMMRDRKPVEIRFEGEKMVEIMEIDEGDEPEDLFQGESCMKGINRKLYGTINRSVSRHTPRMFYFSSISGEFKVSEVLCPQRDEENTTPFPFLQEELYQASQPALFLFDNREELWLWQGWWPNTGADDQTGSGAVRWQAERRAAMTAALGYWRKIHPEGNRCAVYLVWAGLEPLEFIHLFPTWANRDEIAELNIKDGRTPGEMLSLENELTRLTQSTYPPAQLLQRPLPEGVDPTSLEVYLSPQHFQELLGMNMEEFQKLPAWKQIDIKKKIGLF